MLKVIFRPTDVVISGLPQYTLGHHDLKSSLSYDSDDYTWCVQKAKYLPLWISFFGIAPPAVWFAVFGLGYVNGFVLFFFVQLDPKPEIRKLDLNHTLYLIALPSWIGFSQRFYPKHWPLRLYYMITLIYGMIFTALGLYYLLDFSIKRFRADQIHKIAELIDLDFRLAGTAVILEKVREQGMVRTS